MEDFHGVCGVYLQHLSDPVNPNFPAQHYLGASKDIGWRDELHRAGEGAKMLRAANERGISYEIVRVWITDTPEEAYQLEAKLKRLHNSPKLCPVCSGEKVL